MWQNYKMGFYTCYRNIDLAKIGD